MDLVTLIVHNIFSFIVIISVIVFIHEYGHYWVAKKCGVKIVAFSIGFGKEIWGWNDKSGTRWKVSLFPLGGYVQMFGDENAASVPDNEKVKELTEEEKKVAFPTQPLLSRFAIVSAGPIANFILAIIILSFFFFHYGRPESTATVGKVIEESAAAEAGLQVGDVITELDGTSITLFRDIQGIVMMNPNIELSLIYKRDEQEFTGTITPHLSDSTDAFGNKVEIGLIGITSGEAIHRKLSFFPAVWAAVTETYSLSVRTLKAVGQMITGQRDAKQLSGILRIAEYSGQSVDKGLRTVFWFMAILSINLGLINLFPIPMLDGGHLFFYVIEALRGKPLSEKTQEYSFRVGLTLLLMLMVFATYNDLRHFDIF